MRTAVLWGIFTVAVVAGPAGAVAQEAQAPTREATIEEAQAEKVKDLHPYVENKAERVIDRLENAIINGPPRWHPFFDSAYAGGGFTFGAGYAHHLSSYNLLDVRGSYTITGYKRVEAELVMPELFSRRGTLSLLGGWREATEVGFYGLGTDTSKDDRTNYDFKRPYASGLLTIHPTRRNLLLRAGLEWTQWSQHPGHGSFPSVERVFTPATLPGLDATATYLHTQATVGFDWRTTPGYTRRGGYYGVTGHDYHDRDGRFGFQQVDYEAIQHFPILREAWVISLHGLVQTAFDKDDQQTPFFMLPALGGGSSLRGYSSWRFRDQNSLLLQAEWRIMVNRFFDSAVFYDAGKVTARTSDLDLKNLKSDFGFGIRFHSPISTPIRLELARGNEGLTFIFSASPVF